MGTHSLSPHTRYFPAAEKENYMAETAFTVKVINHLTGEISEVEVKGPDTAKNAYLELSASESAIKKAKKQLANFLDEWLGVDEQHRFPDGKVLRRVQRETKQYRVASLRKYLQDEDQIEVCLKVDNKATDVLVGELIEKGELAPGTLKKIKEEADTKATAPFVEIR